MISKDNSITRSTIEEGYDFYITDNWNKKYHFKISTFPVPSGMLSEAIEVVDIKPENEPRIFHTLSDSGADIEQSEMLLKAKIKKRINQRHLINENGKLLIGDEQQLRGRIEGNNNFSDTEFANIFVIDGKRITIEKFAEMVECYTGFNFKFNIYDSCDELD
jgi:hypothetical protein